MHGVFGFNNILRLLIEWLRSLRYTIIITHDYYNFVFYFLFGSSFLFTGVDANISSKRKVKCFALRGLQPIIKVMISRNSLIAVFPDQPFGNRS